MTTVIKKNAQIQSTMVKMSNAQEVKMSSAQELCVFLILVPWYLEVT